MLGKLVVEGTSADSVPFDNPDTRNLVKEVSLKVSFEICVYNILSLLLVCVCVCVYIINGN